MAANFPESESTDPFVRAEHSIQVTFNTLIQRLTSRRDLLLKKLHEMRVSYLSKEETRLKHVRDLDQLIAGIEQTTVEQNLVVKLQEEQIRKVGLEKEGFQLPTPIPVPHFISSGLEDLRSQMEMFGALRDVALPYSTKIYPIRSIGEKGQEMAQLSRSAGVVTDGEGNMFIADTYNKRIQIINLEGKFIGEFGKRELSLGNFLALYKEWIFVTDSSLNHVLKYNFHRKKFECKSEFEFSRPLGISVDDEVFVADYFNNRIVVLRLDLRSVRELGNEILRRPTDVQVNMNKLFVAHRGEYGNNIFILSKLGDTLNNVISLRDGSGWVCISFDQFNNILISDCIGRIIQIFTLEGYLVHSIECDYNPGGIAATKDNTIICVDYYNSKIYLY